MTSFSEIALDRPIAFHRCFVDITGSVNAALMLSQAVYWMKRAPSGEFYKTAEEWREETGLTQREQDTARKKLRKLDFWHEELKDAPAKLHYSIDFEALDEALNKVRQIRESRFNKCAKLNDSELTNLSEQKRESSFDKSANLDSTNARNKNQQMRETYIRTETTTETTTENEKEVRAADVVDFKKFIFDAGIRLLADAGDAESKARAKIGKLRKEYGDADVLAALSVANEKQPSEPYSFLVGILKKRTGQSDKPRASSGYSNPQYPAGLVLTDGCEI